MTWDKGHYFLILAFGYPAGSWKHVNTPEKEEGLAIGRTIYKENKEES